MNAHTPGPWMAHEGLDYVCVLRPDDTTDVAISVDNVEDARLIAAAPDLLAALQAFVARAEQLNGVNTGPLAQARAAIAKAKGE